MTQPESEPVGMVAAWLQIQERFAPAPGEQQRKNLHRDGVCRVGAEMHSSTESRRAIERYGSLGVLESPSSGQQQAEAMDYALNDDSRSSARPVQTLTPAQVRQLLGYGLGEGLEEDLSGRQEIGLPTKQGQARETGSSVQSGGNVPPAQIPVLRSVGSGNYGAAR